MSPTSVEKGTDFFSLYFSLILRNELIFFKTMGRHLVLTLWSQTHSYCFPICFLYQKDEFVFTACLPLLGAFWGMFGYVLFSEEFFKIFQWRFVQAPLVSITITRLKFFSAWAPSRAIEGVFRGSFWGIFPHFFRNVQK